MYFQVIIYDYGVYWLLSGVNVLCILLTLALVKETKNKSLEEIARLYGSTKSTQNCPIEENEEVKLPKET